MEDLHRVVTKEQVIGQVVLVCLSAIIFRKEILYIGLKIGRKIRKKLFKKTEKTILNENKNEE